MTGIVSFFSTRISLSLPAPLHDAEGKVCTLSQLSHGGEELQALRQRLPPCAAPRLCADSATRRGRRDGGSQLLCLPAACAMGCEARMAYPVISAASGEVAGAVLHMQSNTGKDLQATFLLPLLSFTSLCKYLHKLAEQATHLVGTTANVNHATVPLLPFFSKMYRKAPCCQEIRNSHSYRTFNLKTCHLMGTGCMTLILDDIFTSNTIKYRYEM